MRIANCTDLMNHSGHLRSMCILSARIAHSRAVHVTILVSSSGNVVQRVAQEVSRCASVEGVNVSSKVRYVASRRSNANHVSS